MPRPPPLARRRCTSYREKSEIYCCNSGTKARGARIVSTTLLLDPWQLCSRRPLATSRKEDQKMLTSGQKAGITRKRNYGLKASREHIDEML